MVRGISDRGHKTLIGDTGHGAHLSPTRYLFLPRSKSMLLPSRGTLHRWTFNERLRHAVGFSTRGRTVRQLRFRAMTGTLFVDSLDELEHGYVRLVVPHHGTAAAVVVDDVLCAKSPPRTQATISDTGRRRRDDPARTIHRLWRSCQWQLRSHAFGDLRTILCICTLVKCPVKSHWEGGETKARHKIFLGAEVAVQNNMSYDGASVRVRG
jgi:hypothetical protein